MHSYLKCRKQVVKTNDTESVFQILLSVIPEGSISGQVLFKIVIIDLFFIIKDIQLANLSDGNAIYATRNSIEELIKLLEKESKPVINWFKTNNMISKPR